MLLQQIRPPHNMHRIQLLYVRTVLNGTRSHPLVKLNWLPLQIHHGNQHVLTSPIEQKPPIGVAAQSVIPELMERALPRQFDTKTATFDAITARFSHYNCSL